MKKKNADKWLVVLIPILIFAAVAGVGVAKMIPSDLGLLLGNFIAVITTVILYPLVMKHYEEEKAIEKALGVD